MLVLPHTGYAQEFQKNGVPCVAEICLGDGIAEVSKIQWDRKRNPFSTVQSPSYTSVRKVSASETKDLNKGFRGDLVQIAPFLIENTFDSMALQSINRVTVACVSNSLRGEFTTPSGNLTHVYISLVPDLLDSSIQKWKVMTIIREFPGAVSEEQKNKIGSELKLRYHAFGAENMDIRNPKGGEGRYYRSTTSNYGFELRLYNGGNEANRRTLHPSCGGSAKVSID